MLSTWPAVGSWDKHVNHVFIIVGGTANEKCLAPKVRIPKFQHPRHGEYGTLLYRNQRAAVSAAS
jgi:hypothetical protein